jgi:poly(3-hydroxybutyrate) depolymerase
MVAAGDAKTAVFDPNHEINDSSRENLLADARDSMMSVRVKLPNGKFEDRQYEIHLPNGMKTVPADAHLPVVFAFDGTTANKPYTGMAVDNKINAEADRDGFIAIYPLPKPRSASLTVFGLATGIGGKTFRDWNAPGVGSLPTDPTYNDVDFVKAVISDVDQKFHPQAGIKAVGMSLGGEFIRKLDADLPKGTFSSEYIVSSTEFGTEGLPTNVSGVPIKMVRGENDPILPYYGVMHQDFPWYKNAVMRGAEATTRTDSNCPPCMVNDFLTANGYQGNFQLPVDHGTYSESTYNTPTGAKIVYDTVYGAGHFWFGVQTGGSHETVATSSNGFNPPASAFDATPDMARWFGLRHD